MYTKLAITNIKNNRQFYFPYLLTGIITVAMFYIMCALESNPGIQSMPGAKNLGLILRLGIGVIGIFAVIFLVYTNRCYDNSYSVCDRLSVNVHL